MKYKNILRTLQIYISTDIDENRQYTAWEMMQFADSLLDSVEYHYKEKNNIFIAKLNQIRQILDLSKFELLTPDHRIMIDKIYEILGERKNVKN